MQFFLNPHGKVKLIRLALMSFLEIVMPLKIYPAAFSHPADYFL
jgi:hypothetical protein